MERILILGVGNTLLGDEGFGVHAMRYLAERYTWPENVRLVDGGTLGLLLMAELLEADLAVILDIAQGDHEPGTFYEFTDAELGGTFNIRHSMHQTSIQDVLISCSLAGHKPDTVIYAMEPYEFNTLQPYLTAQAAAQLPIFCEKVLIELKKRGIIPVS